jgi:hypothetical protein
MLLIFKIVFVSNDHGLNFIVRIIFDFEEPFVEILKAISFGDVENQKGCDRAFVVGPRDRLERLLSCLSEKECTVSHICILMLILSTLMFLEPNSTPSVGSWSVLKRPSVNLRRRQDFPTPEIGVEVLESPMIMNLNMKS